jgi:Sulfotransferase family
MISRSRPSIENLLATPKRNNRSSSKGSSCTSSMATLPPVTIMRKENTKNTRGLDKPSRITTPTTSRNAVQCFCVSLLICSYIGMMLRLHRLAELHLSIKGVLPRSSLPLPLLVETNTPTEAIRPASRSGQEASGIRATAATITINRMGVLEHHQKLQKPSLVLDSHHDQLLLAFNHNDTASSTSSFVKAGIALYGGGWDGAPIVVEEYKLVVYTQPKVASTTLKQLLRRMMHLQDWSVHKEPHLPHDPNHNGLRYLYHYPPSEVNAIMTSPYWTRAIFVRDPKERFLSAYLDKAVRKNGTYVQRHCCSVGNNVTATSSCSDRASQSLLGFLKFIDHPNGGCCCDPHWKRQSSRVKPSEHWKYINFVGHFETLAIDTKRLLLQLDKNNNPRPEEKDAEGKRDVALDDQAWRTYGASGWGIHGNESIFAKNTGVKHETKAYEKLRRYNTSPLVERLVEDFYQEDYDHALFNFSRYSIVVTGNDKQWLQELS